MTLNSIQETIIKLVYQLQWPGHFFILLIYYFDFSMSPYTSHNPEYYKALIK